jgi:tetratricopeptide (TPR) repeat protein
LSRRRSAAALALVCLIALAASSRAQEPNRPRRFFDMRMAISGPRVSERAAEPLSPVLEAMVERARGYEEAGRLDAARDTLNAALARAPHHPEILLEIADVLQARSAWKALEQFARSERATAHDSLLLANDLVLACERLGKPKEAAQAALEAWIASPASGIWAKTKLDSLGVGDPKGIREAALRVASAFPLRTDMVRGAAGIAWSTGDPASAMRLLRSADGVYRGAPLRWAFAEELLASGVSRDSSGAVESLLDLVGDRGRDLPYRLVAARRAWDVYQHRGGTREGASRVAHALEDVPAARWGTPLSIEVIRALRESGDTETARRLLGDLGGPGTTIPEIALEHTLNDLRDGPPERALESLRALAQGSESAAFQYAEALFFSGQPDSALTWYERASHDPSRPTTGAALERIYVIEDAQPKEALPLYGRMAYEEWRNNSKKALAMAESLYRSLPHASLWAQAAITLAALREKAGEGKAALEPLLAVAEGLPNDRLAPIARQRAGDVYRSWYHDDAKALAQYEECLARYPKAWNAPEVRRRLEAIRREGRF